MNVELKGTRDKRLLVRLYPTTLRDADRTCRKNLLKTIFVRLALERGKTDEAFHWLIPTLKVVVGDEKEIFSMMPDENMSSDTNSSSTTATTTITAHHAKSPSIFQQKLELIPLFTRAIICLLTKTKCLELNPKEMQRKCLVGMQGSPQWKHMYREFLQHKGNLGELSNSICGG